MCPSIQSSGCAFLGTQRGLPASCPCGGPFKPHSLECLAPLILVQPFLVRKVHVHKLIIYLNLLFVTERWFSDVCKILSEQTQVRGNLEEVFRMCLFPGIVIFQVLDVLLLEDTGIFLINSFSTQVTYTIDQRIIWPCCHTRTCTHRLTCSQTYMLLLRGNHLQFF